MEKEGLVTLEEPQVYLIRRPYDLADPNPHIYSDYGGKGHSTKHGAHNSNAHTKKRKAKRRLNKTHNK